MNLTASEKRRFEQLCTKDGTGAGPLLAEMVRACLRDRTTVLISPQEWERMSVRSLEWWLR